MPRSPTLWRNRVAPEHVLRVAVLLGSLLSPAAAAAQPSLSALPTRPAELKLSLGAFDDPVLAFSRISGLTVDPDGRLYVLQAIEGVVTVLNPDGTLHRRFGRKGQGPGEFQSPGGMGWQGDTLWVADVAQQRLSWFHEGEHVRTSRFVPVRLERGARMTFQWPMADGSYFTIVTWRFEKPAGHPDNYLPLIRTTADGGAERVVAVLREHFPFRLVIRLPNGVSYGSPLFEDFPLQSTSDSGERMAIVDRPFVEGAEAPIRLTILDASGDTTYSREYRVEVVPLTDRQWNERIREALARSDRPDRPFGVRELEEASRRPAHWPSATQVVLGSDLSAWIALADLPWRSERDWVAVDDEGVPLFKVTLPREFSLSTASGDVLWGVWRDELDVPHVQRYRVRKAGG